MIVLQKLSDPVNLATFAGGSSLFQLKTYLAINFLFNLLNSLIDLLIALFQYIAGLRQKKRFSVWWITIRSVIIAICHHSCCFCTWLRLFLFVSFSRKGLWKKILSGMVVAIFWKVTFAVVANTWPYPKMYVSLCETSTIEIFLWK